MYKLNYFFLKKIYQNETMGIIGKDMHSKTYSIILPHNVENNCSQENFFVIFLSLLQQDIFIFFI